MKRFLLCTAVAVVSVSCHTPAIFTRVPTLTNPIDTIEGSLSEFSTTRLSPTKLKVAKTHWISSLFGLGPNQDIAYCEYDSGCLYVEKYHFMRGIFDLWLPHTNFSISSAMKDAMWTVTYDTWNKEGGDYVQRIGPSADGQPLATHWQRLSDEKEKRIKGADVLQMKADLISELTSRRNKVFERLRALVEEGKIGDRDIRELEKLVADEAMDPIQRIEQLETRCKELEQRTNVDRLKADLREIEEALEALEKEIEEITR